jgi:hypothetical protein
LRGPVLLCFGVTRHVWVQIRTPILWWWIQIPSKNIRMTGMHGFWEPIIPKSGRKYPRATSSTFLIWSFCLIIHASIRI